MAIQGTRGKLESVEWGKVEEEAVHMASSLCKGLLKDLGSG